PIIEHGGEAAVNNVLKEQAACVSQILNAMRRLRLMWSCCKCCGRDSSKTIPTRLWMGRFSAAFIGRSKRPTRLRVVMSSQWRSNDKPALQGLQRAIMARRLVQVLFPHEVSEPVHGAAVRCV